MSIWQLWPRSVPALVKEAMSRGGGFDPPPSADGWLVGEGVALGMIDTVPPGGHFSDASACAARGWQLRTRRRHGRIRQRHRNRASPDRGDRARRARCDSIRCPQSDTDHGGHDTGAYRQHRHGRCRARHRSLRPRALRDEIIAFAAEHGGGTPAEWTLVAGAVVRGAEQIPACGLVRAARRPGRRRLLATGTIDRHAALGGLQRSGLPHRREQAHRRDQDSAQRARRRCGPGHQSDAMPRPGRRRRRAIARRDALRGNGDRR